MHALACSNQNSAKQYQENRRIFNEKVRAEAAKTMQWKQDAERAKMLLNQRTSELESVKEKLEERGKK